METETTANRFASYVFPTQFRWNHAHFRSTEDQKHARGPRE